MTEQQYEDDGNDQQQQEDSNVPNWRRKLEAEAKAGRDAQRLIDEANAVAKQAQRELAMARAGIDISSPLGSMFAKAYDGEVDVDLIKSEFAKLLPGAEGRPQTGNPAAAAAMQRISEAQAGGVASGGEPHDFASELESIPVITENGQYNHDYVKQVLAATAAQAEREGRAFSTDNTGDLRFHRGSGPVTTPL
jgi:hypothetical protein